MPSDRLTSGLAVLRRLVGSRHLIDVAPQVHERTGFLAGSDEVRLHALREAFADTSTDLLWCARGGYGATRLLSRLDPAPLRSSDRAFTVVGFSDITALLCWAFAHAERKGIHGPVITQLGTLIHDDLDRLHAWLVGEVPSPLAADEGEVLVGGTVEGPLIAANLEVLRSLVGTRHLPNMTGAIVALEDVGERPYRLDRALTQLVDSGAFRDVRGFVVGQLWHCEEPPGRTDTSSPTAAHVVGERLARLGVPVAMGFPFGHDPQRNAALPFGARVRLHADDATLEFLEPVRHR